MATKTYLSNVVDKTTMRSVQSTVLKDLSTYLLNSFGPKGSNTCIKKLNALNMYSKDGHTILKSIAFNGIVEQSIKDDIESITLNIVNTVGDGTTSAVILSDILFEKLLKYIEENPGVSPADIERDIMNCCKVIMTKIKKSATEPTIEGIREIAYISSNGSNWIADMIEDIYKQFGMGVFIDVSPSLGKETSLKFFDGMTINTGYSDSCFVTDTRNNTCVVDHPNIYFFEDPVDNKEMGVLLDAILSKNIIEPMRNRNFATLVPTVIVASHISRDMSSLIDTIVDYQSNLAAGNKIPCLLITGTHQVDEIQDIYKLCGAKPIHKYIDAEIYKKDIENGLAPTPETVTEWAGHADEVVAHSNKTKFINPACMKNEDGTFSNIYLNLLDYLEKELSKQQGDGEIKELGLLKRRINSLKSNLVEISVGGMTVADRDSNRHLVEDAVCNCRSAAANGIGWGANVSAFIALNDLIAEYNDEESDNCADCNYDIIMLMYEAYTDLVAILYSTMFADRSNAEDIADKILENRMPYNIRTNEFDGKVKSSIESDCIILDSVAKIISIMVTCNQMIVPTPQHNVYTDLREIG